MEIHPADILTPEEIRVAECCTTGRTTKEMADHLGKSVHTIFRQIQSIYEKARIPHNLTSLAVWYLCRTHGIALPEFIRRCGASLLLALFLTTVTHTDDLYRRSRRSRRAREYEWIIEPESN